MMGQPIRRRANKPWCRPTSTPRGNESNLNSIRLPEVMSLFVSVFDVHGALGAVLEAV